MDRRPEQFPNDVRNDHPLVPWLINRLDELESTARAASPGPWAYNPFKQWNGSLKASPHASCGNYVTAGPLGDPFWIAMTQPANEARMIADAAHIAQHDPRAVLARVAAERQILALHARPHACPSRASGDDEPDAPDTGRGNVCPTIRLLAAGYRHTVGFSEEWLP